MPKPRFIFCVQRPKNAVGGIKVIYQHAARLEKLGYEALVCHPGRSEEHLDWFESDARIVSQMTFDPSADFIILPEAWALNEAPWFRDGGCRYALFVQNGHYLFNNVKRQSHIGELQERYDSATAVMTVSKHVEQMVKLGCPSTDNSKMHRVSPAIEPIFSGAHEKTRTITFMPRKHENHAEILYRFLSVNLPRNWRMEPIQDVSHGEVAEILSRSCIFLSFSDMEGLGLPPLEAAASGNLVVGYTGAAGSEYFNAPVFRPVETGDIQQFVAQTLKAVQDVENGLLGHPDFGQAVADLKSKFSEENSLAELKAFAEAMAEYY